MEEQANQSLEQSRRLRRENLQQYTYRFAAGVAAGAAVVLLGRSRPLWQVAGALVVLPIGYRLLKGTTMFGGI